MPGLPGDVARVLDDFVAAVRDAFGDQLESAVLYGSGAEGALRATSDVNVVRLRAAYVERGLHEEQLVAVVADAAPPLRTAGRFGRLTGRRGSA